MVIIVMGTTGAGKTTIGTALASRLGWLFADADDYHPQPNIDKMSAGMPLDDRDREPWLAAMRQDIDRWQAEGRDAVLACSALKRAYRDRLRGDDDSIVFVYLQGSFGAIEARIESRAGHFAKSDLLASQFETLEEPAAEENVLVVPVSLSPEAAVDEIVERLGLVPAG